jgi:hypothetical protein
VTTAKSDVRTNLIWSVVWSKDYLHEGGSKSSKPLRLRSGGGRLKTGAGVNSDIEIDFYLGVKK